MTVLVAVILFFPLSFRACREIPRHQKIYDILSSTVLGQWRNCLGNGMHNWHGPSCELLQCHYAKTL